jgi:hypothetical protein
MAHYIPDPVPAALNPALAVCAIINVGEEDDMRYMLVPCVIIFLVLFSLAGAEDLRVFEDYLPRYGDYYRPRDGTLQQYDDYTPRFGNYLKREDGRLQEHEDYLPQHGDYYKWNGSRWQRYEDYLPVFGDYLDE